MKPDINDLFLIIGIILIIVGLWMIYIPFSLIILGALIMGVIIMKEKDIK